MSEIKFKEPCGGCGQEYASKRCFGCHHEAIDWNRRAPVSALPGEAEVVAWTDDTDEQVPVASRGVTRNIETAKYWEHTAGAPITPLVTLASLQAMQARAEKAERELSNMLQGVSDEES